MIGYRSAFGEKDAQPASEQQSARGGPLDGILGPLPRRLLSRALLQEGANTITILEGWGWYDVDYIKLSPAEPLPGRIANELVNPNATPEARALMSYLVDMHGKAILSGQQDYKNLPWLAENVGKLPAIVGFDFMDDSPSRVERGTRSNETELAIRSRAKGASSLSCGTGTLPRA